MMAQDDNAKARRESLAQAQRFQQAGFPSRAEEIYKQLLRADSSDGEVYLLLGIAQVAQGKLEDAITSYQRAVELRPDAGGAFLNLADALQRKNQHEQAAACLQECLRRIPAFPDAHYNLGNVLQSLGRLEEAADHYRQAAKLRPDFAEAHNNLGGTYLLLEKTDEAVASFQNALRLRSNYPEVLHGLGGALRDRNQVAEGARCYQRALQLRPDYAAAHNGLGEAFIELGEPQKAQFHFRRALTNNPNPFRPLFNLAKNGLYTDKEASIEQLQNILTEPRLPRDFACLIHFILGRLFDRSGNLDASFDHYRQGGAIRRELFQKTGTAFDPVIHAKGLDGLVEAFSSEYFQRMQGFGVDSRLPTFIVGMPRSGTSLVEQILSHHPSVYGAGELPYARSIAANLSKKLGAVEDYPNCLRNLDAKTTRELGEDYLRRLAAQQGTAERIIDKMPLNFLRLGLIATLFPRAAIIYCRRDPRDVCLSCLMHYFRGYNFACTLEDLGAYYREHVRLMEHWRQVLPLAIFEVVYEDLVANQESVSRRLVEFCGLEWNSRCLRFHESRRPVRSASALEVRQPVYATSVGRWQRYARHLEPLFMALGDILQDSSSATKQPTDLKEATFLRASRKDT
jgi:tetratricopeptide (TPR) repeat protein